MKKTVFVLIFLVAVMLSATQVSIQRAEELALFKLGQIAPTYSIYDCVSLEQNGATLAYVFSLNPTGYLCVSAQDVLPPLLAYSTTSSFGSESEPILRDLVKSDLSNRLQSESEAVRNQLAWQTAFVRDDYQQWPPEGYSPTGGWLKTNWTQSAPYNWMCPMDPVTNVRSYAGCPAVAMGMIINYHKALNGTRLNDADDYYHGYAGRNYWIDNDYATIGFPSFPQLNGYLDEVNTRFRYDQELSDSLKAAIIFAAGTAMKQVYTSQGSGTFGVNQAFAGFQRFNFPNVELLTDANPDLYTRMSDNIKNALPVHLAVVTPAWDSGHNVVVDGYNTNEYYHLNFGWGGSYNGWYLLPSQIPYNLTVIEGAVVDISPYQYVFTVPDTLVCHSNIPASLEVINMHTEAIVLEEVQFDTNSGGYDWTINYSTPLPATISAGGLYTLSLTQNYGGGKNRWWETSLKLILTDGFATIPVKYEVPISVTDEVLPIQNVQVNTYPNPFSSSCSFEVKSNSPEPLKLEIFNLKGQMVFKADDVTPLGTTILEWNGKDANAVACSNGIYLYKLTGNRTMHSGKLLKLK